MTDGKQEDAVGDEPSQYQIRPSVGKTFPVTNVREIINEVLLQVLDGKGKASFRFYRHNKSLSKML